MPWQLGGGIYQTTMSVGFAKPILTVHARLVNTLGMTASCSLANVGIAFTFTALLNGLSRNPLRDNVHCVARNLNGLRINLWVLERPHSPYKL